MLVFGFKKLRWAEWREVLREERRGLTWSGRIGLWLGMFKVGWQARLFICEPECRVTLRRAWRPKMRTCPRCVVYDRQLRRCRPFSGSPLGCGCYVPFLALLKPHCWGHARPELRQRGVLGW